MAAPAHRRIFVTVTHPYDCLYVTADGKVRLVALQFHAHSLAMAVHVHGHVYCDMEELGKEKKKTGTPLDEN
jgi:hypothetical protein